MSEESSITGCGGVDTYRTTKVFNLTLVDILATVVVFGGIALAIHHWRELTIDKWWFVLIIIIVGFVIAEITHIIVGVPTMGGVYLGYNKLEDVMARRAKCKY
jgi:chromate transport protein ChrA